MPALASIRFFWVFAVLEIIACSGCSKSNSTHERDPFTASTPAPNPPEWVNEMPSVPDWWTNVAVSYNDGDSISNKWSKVKAMETNIEAMVHQGVPPTKERQQLVKYLTVLGKSQNVSQEDKIFLKFETAMVYEKLGDYKWAVKDYAELVSNSPEDIDLYSLAIQYERLGDRAAALQIYSYMARSFETNSDGCEIGKRGIACLTCASNGCVLEKPNWWNQYQNLPDWWLDTKIDWPHFTSWNDGDDFIVHNVREKGDKRSTIKALALLSQFSPITFNEKTMSLLLIGHAYSDTGDHHRAIETAWQIPEQFPCDPIDSIIALEFIESEFVKLGDSTNAAKIKDDISCFKSNAIKTGLKPWPR